MAAQQQSLLNIQNNLANGFKNFEKNIINLINKKENSLLEKIISNNNIDPLAKLDKKYFYTINSEIIFDVFGIKSNSNITEGFYLQYINNELVLDHLHTISYYITTFNNQTLNIINHDNWLTSEYIPFSEKFPMANFSHSKIPVNNFKLLTTEEKNMLRNSDLSISNPNLIKFCENIINKNDNRFKAKKLIGNLDEAYLYTNLLNPVNNEIITGAAHNIYDIFFIDYENEKYEFFYITNIITNDPILKALTNNMTFQMLISTSFDGVKFEISDTFPEQFTKHSTLPAMSTTVQFKIVNVNIIQNENIEISFDVSGGWIWRDLTNEPMQMAAHVDGEGHAHIHIGGKKLGRTYNGKYTITKEELNDYINNEFLVPDPLNITISLVNNMHQGYTNQSLDLEHEKIYGIYYYEPVNVDKIKNINGLDPDIPLSETPGGKPLLNATKFTDGLGNVNDVNVILDGDTITFMSTSPTGESETYIMTSSDGITYTQMYDERSFESSGNILKYTGSRVVLSNAGTLVGASLFNYYTGVPEALVGFLKPNEWNLSGTIS